MNKKNSNLISPLPIESNEEKKAPLNNSNEDSNHIKEKEHPETNEENKKENE